MKDRRVYVAILVAAAKGTGLRLTPQEVSDLSLDDAIMTVAMNDLTPEECDLVAEHSPCQTNFYAWRKVKP